MSSETSKGPKHPEKAERFSFSAKPSEFAALVAESKQTGVPVSRIIRDALARRKEVAK